jgi:hypothetical protein
MIALLLAAAAAAGDATRSLYSPGLPVPRFC